MDDGDVAVGECWIQTASLVMPRRLREASYAVLRSPLPTGTHRAAIDVGLAGQQWNGKRSRVRLVVGLDIV